MDSRPQNSQEIAFFMDAIYAETFKGPGLPWLQEKWFISERGEEGFIIH